jgi:hypothetical protein
LTLKAGSDGQRLRRLFDGAAWRDERVLPFRGLPAKPAVDVPTPSIGRVPVFVSSTYTPGGRHSARAKSLRTIPSNASPPTAAPIKAMKLKFLYVSRRRLLAMPVTPAVG